MASRPLSSQLVVIGSSAGGIDALSTLVSTLPADFPAPIVIAQHLDPRRASHLTEILTKRSTLPVQTVTDRVALRPGVVFVVPANRHVEITDHEIQLRENNLPSPKPSIDLLFRSAAHVYGEGLIAVVLTGTGNDGAAGARDVKVAGGTVLVQNPETASYPALPSSLAPTTVDMVANLEAIGPLLHDLLTGAIETPRPDEERQLRGLLEQLRDRSGIDFSTYKTPTIMRRLHRRMVATGNQNLREYTRYLQRQSDEYRLLINSFLIKVTEFFRDAELFNYLRDEVLPRLIDEARDRNEELRLWSAGCATGEEAYSLAILISELLGDDLQNLPVRIFATDLDSGAIDFARRGIYPASVLADVPDDLVERYYTFVDGSYEITKRVRNLVVFGQHDLGQRAPFPRIDLALCRNVLIYFTTELQKRALQLFAFSLRDGGCLVLGKAESVSPLAELFSLEQPRLKVYRRVGDRILIPPARIRDTVPSAPSRSPLARRPLGALDLTPGRALRESRQLRTTSDRMQGLLSRLPIGVVVVDPRYDIQSINSAARTMLGVHTPAIGDDFIHLVQVVPASDLRRLIDRAFRGEAHSAIYEVPSVGSVQARCLQVSCHPERIESKDGPFDSVLVLVTDVTSMIEQTKGLTADGDRLRAEIGQLTQQLERVSAVNSQILEANQELASANAELRSTNEELLVANEEVQAATEEVETLNEELQATNEELETLNEELQATVEELNTTNDDLQARSVELQDLAASLEEQRRASDTERSRLHAVLQSMNDAVLVVDRRGQTILTNPAWERMFGTSFAELDLEDGSERLDRDRRPEIRAARGEAFTMSFSLRDRGGSRRWFEASGQAAQADGEGQGVVVIRDITDRRRGP